MTSSPVLNHSVRSPPFVMIWFCKNCASPFPCSIAAPSELFEAVLVQVNAQSAANLIAGDQFSECFSLFAHVLQCLFVDPITPLRLNGLARFRATEGELDQPDSEVGRRLFSLSLRD